MNIITLKNVNDSVYPPQKKSFSMLKYFYDNKAKYKWFLRLDDDAVLQLNNVQNFLTKLDSTRLLYIGNDLIDS